MLLLFSALLCHIFPAVAQENATNAEPRQVAIEAKWVEIPEKAFATLNLGVGSTNESGTNWVLPPDQATQLVQTVQAMTNASLVAAPRVVTWVHRDAHIALQEDVVIVTGIKPAVTVPPGITLAKIDEAYETQSLPVGQWVDVLPEFSEDTHRFRLTLVAERTEMQGYDRYSRNETVLVWINNKRSELKAPVPRYRKTRRFNVAEVPNGNTLVFSGFKAVSADELGGNAPMISVTPRVFLVLVTPVALDAHGIPVEETK